MRIVFFGTPDFAVASLKRLLAEHATIVAVVTSPDKPAGRGLQLQESAVKQYAQSVGLRVLQPTKLKDEQFIATLQSLEADLFIVIAFRMLPESVWTMPPLGTFNLHASLLPAYRGAAPINWAIINGETETGVTTFFLKHEIDTGDILFQEKVAITPSMNAGNLHDLLMEKGADLVAKSVSAISAGNYQMQLQSGTVKHAPKIFKAHCLINWDQSTQAVFNLIRGMSPYPTAHTFLHEKQLKIMESEMEISSGIEAPGTVVTDEKTYLKFATTDGYIKVLTLQLEGKKRMATKDFLAGYKWN
jgi:methionyl-tRNA formyltransferase